MNIIQLDEHLVAEQDLSAWVEANIEWLADHGVPTQIKSYRYELIKVLNEWSLEIFYSPESKTCGSCDDTAVPEQDPCTHEWYKFYRVNKTELWSAR